MTFEEYQKGAARTIRNDLPLLDARKHALFGLCAEVGELLGIFQKELQGHSVSEAQIVKEGGRHSLDAGRIFHHLQDQPG